MIVDKNLPNGFSPNRTKNLLEQREEQQTYIWKAGTRVGSEICEMAITEFRECTRIDLLTERGSRTTGQYWPEVVSWKTAGQYWSFLRKKWTRLPLNESVFNWRPMLTLYLKVQNCLNIWNSIRCDTLKFSLISWIQNTSYSKNLNRIQRM